MLKARVDGVQQLGLVFSVLPTHGGADHVLICLGRDPAGKPLLQTNIGARLARQALAKRNEVFLRRSILVVGIELPALIN
jgi:hypothetical protein